MNAPDPVSASGPIGIIAGSGSLPGLVARAAVASGRGAFVVALDGFADETLGAYPHVRLRFGEAARILRELRAAGARDLVLVGGLSRPAGWGYLRDVGPSVLWRALRNLDLFGSGDSTMLQRIVTALEREGFNILGAHEVAPDLVLPPMDLGAVTPNLKTEPDIARGFAAALGLGALDIGQGVVVARGRVLAAEAAEGTDAMLARVAGMRAQAAKDGRRLKPLGVLVKAPQPIQDIRVDMPAIGPDTVAGVADAGLQGIAIAAARVLVLNPEEVRRLADEAGVFVTARQIDGPGTGSGK